MVLSVVSGALVVREGFGQPSVRERSEHGRVLRVYESWLRDSVKPLTYKAYIRDVKRFLEFIGKNSWEVSALDASLWYNHLRGQGFSERSICRMGWALKKFFKAIGRREVAELIPTPQYEAKAPVWLEEGQVTAVIGAARPGLEKTMLATSYELALRQGEVPLLNRDSYMPASKMMRVRRLKTKGSVSPESLLPIRDWVNDLLMEYLESRRDRCPALFVVYGRGRGGPEPHRISERTVRYVYRRAALRAGVDPDVYPFHAFSRHSRLTHMAINQILETGSTDITSIAKFAGHRAPSSTLLYIHMASLYLAKKGRE